MIAARRQPNQTRVVLVMVVLIMLYQQFSHTTVFRNSNDGIEWKRPSSHQLNDTSMAVSDAEEPRRILREEDATQNPLFPPPELPEPTTRTTPTTEFTKVTQSNGAYHMENVCLGPPSPNDTKTRAHIHLFGDHHNFQLDRASQVWVTSVNHTKEQFPVQQNNGKETYIEEETLFLLDFGYNPAHCLNDQIFSIILDAHEQNSTRTNNGTKKPVFPKYILGKHPSKFFPACPPNNWCCEMLQRSNLIDWNQSIFAPNLNNKNTQDELLCFRKLVVPRFMAHRFPIDWNNPEKPLGNQRLIDWNRGRGMSGPGMYPLAPLKWFQFMLSQSFQLDMSPWPNKIDSQTKKHTILLYDRRGTRRRIISNSQQLKDQIESRFHATVKLVQNEWSNFTIQEQVGLYNSHQIIIAPHGAHLANVLFARPGTVVLEFVPSPSFWDLNGMTGLNPNATSRSLPNLDTEWFGSSSWFSSFSRRLGIQHFASTGQFHPGNLGHMAREFPVNYDLAEKLLITRAGLQTKAEA